MVRSHQAVPLLSLLHSRAEFRRVAEKGAFRNGDRPVDRGVAVMLLGVSAMQAAWAEGPTAGNAADATGITVNSDDVRQAETSERGSDASSAADLEAKRAAMTRRTSPAITLGVTGWVGGQVIVAH